MRARVEGENIPNKRLRFPFVDDEHGLANRKESGHTLAGNHVCNLNDRIYAGFWEDAFPPSTFDIETQDTQRSYF